MGLLDGVAKGLLGKILGEGGSQSPLMEIMMGLISNPQTGGLQGLVKTFQEKGLGDAVSSWIGTGENKPVSGSQIQDALGGSFIQQMAEKVGQSKSEVSGAWPACSPK